jgi:hypothetical protein
MSEISYTVDDTKITKLEKLLWYNNTRKCLEITCGLNFDHFPMVTTASHLEEIDQIYDYLRFVIESREIKEYVDIVANRVRKYKDVNALLNDPMSGMLLKRNNMQSFIIANERKFITELDLFITQNYSEEFISTVDEMIQEYKN